MTAPHFELEVETEAAKDLVRFRLRNRDGQQLAAHPIQRDPADGALWEGVFDTRSHVLRYQGGTRYTDRPATAEDLLERLGVFLGDKVLGPKVTAALADGLHHRTLLVRLPKITGKKEHEADDRLAAALARVPWEIARPAHGEKPLMERNLVVRAVTPDLEHGGFTAPPPEAGEALRVLLVFAEAPGSRPLAMRLERETLLDLFYDQVMPSRRVRVDVLCHGVTRQRLRDQIEDANGYHVVHWSGHGHHDLLELHREDGEDGKPDRLSGGELLDLFAQAGGFFPNLAFLSACLSGTFVQARDWESLHHALVETTPEAADTETATGEAADADVSRAVAKDPGYAGTALALLRAGVPQAIAMRYEVGDAYARDLARGFYHRLLAQQAPKAPAQALALARAELLREHAPEHGAVDHATPLVFGQDLPPLMPPKGRSPQLDERRPQPQPLLPGGGTELDRPTAFVGRGRPLTELRARWLNRLAMGAPAVAVVQGLAGLGKTALVAEAIHLWHHNFKGVYAFQSKPTPLTIDDFLRRLDERLTLHSQTYRDTCGTHPNRRLFLPPSDTLKGEARYQLLFDNLLEALKNEPLLLVLDNFETQLETVAGDNGYACADPQWDHLLAHLASTLPDTPSRLVLTTRHRLAILAPPDRALTIALGPLPMEEAILFLQSTPALRRLAFGDEKGWTLARRLLTISRGHPLILTRLGTLADDPTALEKALQELESKGFAHLPDLFTTKLSEKEREKERQYLEDVAIRSVDLLLERLTPAARRLLWVVTRASEPVRRPLLEGVWSGKTLEQEKLNKLRSLLAMAEELPDELRAQLDQMAPELRAMLEAPEDTPPAPPLPPLLKELLSAGLLTPDDGALAFHELVKERATAWMESHPTERGDRAEPDLWQAYGERYKAAFEALTSAGKPGAREQAAEAGRRGLAYFIRARAFGELGAFASALVTGTRDPSLLRSVISELEAVADKIPAGRDRWALRLNLADAFRMAGRPDAALALYEQAAAEAEAAEYWTDIGSICGNWAHALGDVGRLDAARTTYERSADAFRRAGSPRVNVVGSELEALRIDVMQGDAKRALPEIERRLEEVRDWWRRRREGETVPEAPDEVFLGRALVSALDIARQANLDLERWQACLDLVEEIEATDRSLGEGEHELTRTRFNRHGPLLRLGRLDEVQHLLEGCLQVFRQVDDLTGQGTVLSALAELWDKRGDCGQAAALERQALAVRNRLPDLAGRSISHGNFSSYLDRLGEGLEAARHLLAGIVYGAVMNHHGELSRHLRNLYILVLRSTTDGEPYELPRLADLLKRLDFAALRQVLTTGGVDLEELQQTIDALVDQVRQQTESAG